MGPEELVNLSLQQEVEIEPFTTIAPKSFLTFYFRGCSPLRSCRVPLYFALHLRSLALCSIVHPPYVSKEFITDLVRRERIESSFVELPDFFFEHISLFMTDEIESIVCELRSIRNGKIRKGLSSLDGKALYVTGLTRWEFNEFREMIRGPMAFGKKFEED